MVKTPSQVGIPHTFFPRLTITMALPQGTRGSTTSCAKVRAKSTEGSFRSHPSTSLKFLLWYGSSWMQAELLGRGGGAPRRTRHASLSQARRSQVPTSRASSQTLRFSELRIEVQKSERRIAEFLAMAGEHRVAVGRHPVLTVVIRGSESRVQ